MTADLDEFAKWHARELELTDALTRAQRDLDKAKRTKSEYVETLYHAVRDSMAGLVIPPVPAPAKTKGGRTEEVAVPLLSDLQLAKVTYDDQGQVSYSSEICEQRVEQYAQKIIDLTNVQRSDHPVRKATVVALGDLIEGVDIFPGQQWLLDAGLYRQITVDGPRIVVNFLRKLLTNFDEVEVVWVIGNHGRIGRKGTFDPETNGDRMLGRIVQMLMESEPRVKFTVPDGPGERNWYAVVEVGNWSALAIHGDQIRGHSGFPWYGLGKRVNGWASGAIPQRFDDVLMGHWHQIASIPLNKRTVYVNGSTESYNTFAQENLAAMSDPTQWLLFVHPEDGLVTAEYKVRLT